MFKIIKLFNYFEYTINYNSTFIAQKIIKST